MEAASPQNAPRVFALFFACALVAYALNILARHIEWWGWVQFFAPSAALLLPGLTAGVLLGHKLRWLSVQATAGRYLSGAVIVAASFPLAFAAAVVLSIVLQQVVPPDWRESFPLLKSVLDQASVYLAVLVMPPLAYVSLRVVTGRWDTLVLGLMIGAVALALSLIPLVQALAGERGDDVVGAMFFPFFPLGFSLLCGSYGYGLARTTEGQ